MRKADVVLAVLAVLVLAVTTVAGLSGDRWTEERTLRFATGEQPLLAQATTATSPGQAAVWTVPDNATAANVSVVVAFSGQAFRGGNAIVTVRVTTPDGRTQPPTTFSWAIPQGATSAETNTTLAVTWLEAPGETRDTTAEGYHRSWTEPLEVLVSVERPAGDVPLAQYEFEAAIQATVTVYARMA